MGHRTTFAFLASTLVLATPSHSDAQWDGGPTPRQGACFYQDINYRGSYFCLGAGEELDSMPSGANDRVSSIRVFGGVSIAWYLVLVPQVSVSTKESFASSALTRDSKPLTMSPFLSGQGRNDLEASAVRRYPEIADALAWLRKHSPPGSFPPRMTGSGACVFAEFARREDADALYEELPAAMRGFVARGLEHHPLHDWAHFQ